MLRKKHRPMPVDRGWKDENTHQIAIDTEPLQLGSYMASQDLIDAMTAYRPDVFAPERSGFMIVGNKMIRLQIQMDYDLREAFVVIAALWQAATGRVLTLVPGEPPNSDA